MEYNSEKYDSAQMDRWRARRLDTIFRHYGPNYFQGKTILEVGAALGHIGWHFADSWGANVTCSDHYEPWVKIIKERFPILKTFVQDINKPWKLDQRYDVIIHMGLIYHQPPELVEPRLHEAISYCNEIIIETTAIDNEDPYYIDLVPKPPESEWWEPINTDYCNPSTAFIDRILMESGMTFTRILSDLGRFLWFGKKYDN